MAMNFWSARLIQKLDDLKVLLDLVEVVDGLAVLVLVLGLVHQVGEDLGLVLLVSLAELLVGGIGAQLVIADKNILPAPTGSTGIKSHKANEEKDYGNS